MARQPRGGGTGGQGGGGSSRAEDEAFLVFMAQPTPDRSAAEVAEALINANRQDLVIEALRRGWLEPNAVVGGRYCLVHFAARQGAVPLLRYLIEQKGVDPNERVEETALTPLHLAVGMGHIEAALWLINDAPGVDLEARTADQELTPLMMAAVTGRLAVVKALLAAGADLHAVDCDGRSVAHRPVASIAALQAVEGEAGVGRLLETFEYLVGLMPASWAHGEEAAVLLKTAAYLDRPKFLCVVLRRLLADGGADGPVMGAVTEAVDVATTKGCLGVLGMLIAGGGGKEWEGPVLEAREAIVDLGKSGRTGSFLHLAAVAGQNPAALEFLVARGGDPLLADSVGMMPHHIAACHGHLRILRWLIPTRVPVDEPALAGMRGLTALMLAAQFGERAVCEWLLDEAGADPLSRTQLLNKRGEAIGELVRASDLALAEGYAELAAYLKGKEDAAEAAAAEAARKARNEKRRQKQKKARARKREQQQQQEEELELEALEGGVAALEVAGNGEEQQEQQQQAAAGGLAALEVAGGSEEPQQRQELELELELAQELEQEQELERSLEPHALEPAVAAAEDVEQQQEEQQHEAPADAAAAAAGATAPGGAVAAAGAAGAATEPLPGAPVQEQPAPPPPLPPSLEAFLDAQAPEPLLCPISLSLLDDPVSLAGEGITYSRAAIEQHLAFCRERGKPLTAPSSNLELSEAQAVLVPNILVRGFVADYRRAKTQEWETAMAKAAGAEAGAGTDGQG